MDGFTASKEIRRLGCDAIIIALSAKVLTEIDSKMLSDANIYSCLSKPISFSQLTAVLNNIQ